MHRKHNNILQAPRDFASTFANLLPRFRAPHRAVLRTYECNFILLHRIRYKTRNGSKCFVLRHLNHRIEADVRPDNWFPLPIQSINQSLFFCYIIIKLPFWRKLIIYCLCIYIFYFLTH